MGNRFFEEPILNSPYEYPLRHWELDREGQPTQKIIERGAPPNSSPHFQSPESARDRPSNNR
jgi:type III restriction enzyme